MKIVVIGGSGLIGSRVVANLREQGHEVIAGSPSTGINTITGEGLREALAGASVVVDVSNSPSFEDAAVLSFFQTSTQNLLAAEVESGVGHHVALSVVGTQRLSQSGYFRGKIEQERLITSGPVPFTIVHATQFFEFVKSIADAATEGSTVRLSSALIQPIAADDVARAVTEATLAPPVNGIVEVAGPEQFRLDELIRLGLAARNDPREVVADPSARYYGAELAESTLLPSQSARLGETLFRDWLVRAALAPAAEPSHAQATPRALASNEFRLSDVPPGSAALVGDVAVFNVDGSFCATQEKCTHRGGPLSKGKLEGSTVTCPFHGAQFNVCTGAVLRGPAAEPIQTLKVVVEGDIGRVEVSVPA